MEYFSKSPNWVLGARCAYGCSQKQMAEVLGISETSYRMKEMGHASFTDEEKIELAKIFGFSMYQVNQIFFNGAFPIGNNADLNGKTGTALLP